MESGGCVRLQKAEKDEKESGVILNLGGKDFNL